MAQPLLETKDLCVNFGGVAAVDHVSISVAPGGLYGLIGPNGSGKSTLLGAISRLTQLSSGELFLDGENVTKAKPWTISRMGVSRTFQTVRLLPRLSVIENVALGYDGSVFGTSVVGSVLRPRRNHGHEVKVRLAAMDALEQLDLLDMVDVRPSDLSYGAQRRVEVARALVGKPRLLLFDEPTAGMSHEERSEIADVLGKLRSQGLTQVLVDHDVDLMLGLPDYLFVMNVGRLIAEGTPQEVAADPNVQTAYLGEAVFNVRP